MSNEAYQLDVPAEAPGVKTLALLARAFLPLIGLPKLVSVPPSVRADGALEARIRKAESRYQTLVERIPVVTFMVSFESLRSEIYVSPQVETLLGYTAKEWVENPILWYERLHPDDRDRWNQEFSLTIAKAEAFKSDHRFLARDGRVVWIHGEVTVERDEAGRPSFLQGIGYDITETKRAEEVMRRSNAELEALVSTRTAQIMATNKSLVTEVDQRKKAEEALRESEQRIRMMISAVKDYAIFMLDPEGRIVSWNEGAELINGYSEAEALGRHFSMFYPADPLSQRHAAEELDTARIHGRYEEVGPRVRKDGGHYWAEVVITAVRDSTGHLRGYSKVTRDITARKRAEGRLIASLKELADVKSALDEHAIVAITDPQGRITYVNDAFCAISKYPREELVGQDHRIINSGHHPKEFFRELWSTIASGRVWKGEIRNRAKDGTLYWVETTIVPFVGANGKPEQYVAIRADITARKRAEERQNELLGQLQEINTELNQFAYVVSHDLKAPLRAISSLADWLLADYGEKVGPEGKEQLGLMVGRVRRMNALVDGILRYSRISRQREERVEVEVNKLVREVGDMLSPPPGIALRIAPGLPTVTCERTRLTQVFENLISNAVKYMGGPTGEISVGCEPSGSNWLFHVRDTGTGIEEKYFQKIFQLFQTLTPRDERESTGIGLAVVKKNVELAGGHIWVESTLGAGSTFYFTIPQSAAAKTDGAEPNHE